MLLGTSGVFWGHFGVILVILECRITVCYTMSSQIRKHVLACRALHVSPYKRVHVYESDKTFYNSL